MRFVNEDASELTRGMLRSNLRMQITLWLKMLGVATDTDAGSDFTARTIIEFGGKE